MEKEIFDAAGQPGDAELDRALRPKRFANFVGQSRIKENLQIYIEAARRRDEPLDHILFCGPPGLGKTTLSLIIANEVGAQIHSTAGPVLEKPGDLVGVLTNLKAGDILFIDEIHRLGRTVEEYLYGAMEDYVINILIDQGPSARTVRIPLPMFTLIGSTTRDGLLTGPFRARFGVMERLDFYPAEDLCEIALNSAAKLGIAIDKQAAELIAERSRGTPRIVNRFLRRIRDVAEVKGNGTIDEATALDGLSRLSVDEYGLCEMDRNILITVMRLRGTPVGLKTIAVSIGEEEGTIEEVYEPFLIQQGYLAKAPRGRIGTELAYERYGKDMKPPGPQPSLFNSG